MEKSTVTSIEKRPGVYRLQNLKTGKFYIGSSRNLYMRYYTHRTLLQESRHDNIRIKEDCELYGADSFAFGVVEYCDESIMKDREQFYYELWNPEYNVWKNVYSGIGREYTDSQLGNLRKLPKIAFHTDETKSKMKQAWIRRRAKYSPEELSKKMGDARRGILHSAETKKKFSEMRKGKKKPEGFAEKIRQARLRESAEIKEYRNMKMRDAKRTS